jgi:putative inorganic carbon (hco3(-)) transporter
MIIFYLLVGLMPLSTHPLWEKTVGDVTIFKYLGGLCFLYSLFDLCGRRRLPSLFETWQARLFMLFYVLTTASFIVKSQTNVNLLSSSISGYTSFVLLFLMTSILVDSLYRLRWTFLVIIASNAFASLYVIREWQKYHNLYVDFRPGGGVLGDGNYFSASALLCTPIAFVIMNGKRPGWERTFVSGCLLVTLVGLVLSASRGAFLGLVCAFIYLIVCSKQRFLKLLVLAVMVTPPLLLLPSSPIRRILVPKYGDTFSDDAHVAAWKAGLQMIKAHPLTGVGLGNFKLMMPRYAPAGTTVDSIAHDLYVGIAAEEGLPAVLIFIGMLVATFRTFGRFRRRVDIHPLVRQVSLGGQAGLVGFAVASCFLSTEYQRLLWLIIFLSACLPAIARLKVAHVTSQSKVDGYLPLTGTSTISRHRRYA